ncbi:MAG: response regulator [Nitrospirae bacterium]|nr:MAG: response regulator [Nitrospirota bacterium]
MFDAPREQLGRVMVVDDEADIRKVVRMHLEKANYEVIEATNGEEAIALLNSGDNPVYVDVILCDIRMPKVNGVAAIEYFRQQYPSLPIVVLTGFPDVQMATSFLKQGVLDYLVKPVEKEHLIATIKKAVDQHEMMKGQFTT